MAYATVEDITISTNEDQDTSHTIDFPTTVNDGELLIMINIFWFENQDPTGPGGWTQIFYDAESGTSNRVTTNIYAKDGVSGDSGGSWTPTTANSTTRATHLYRISGWGGTLGTDVDVSASTGEGTSTSADPASVTAGWGSDENLFIEVVGSADDQGSISSPSTGYGNLTETIAGNTVNQYCQLMTARRNFESASDNPDAVTISVSEVWSALTIVVKPASTSGNPRYYYAQQQ